jgi:hypothetical protein
VDRAIRPRRLVILLLILFGFLGGTGLGVWAILRKSSGSPQPGRSPTAAATDNAFEPSPSLPPFAERDTDTDGLLDAEEAELGTDLTLFDTDGDGFSDKAELDAGYDPLGPGKLDTDRDGLADPDERCWQTDLHNADSDGDGYLDGQEVANKFNPRVPGPNDKLSDPLPCF